MKKVALLSVLSLSLALSACGTVIPAPQLTPPAVAQPTGPVLTLAAPQLQVAGLSVTLTGDKLTVSPTGVEAVFRVYLDDRETFGTPDEAGQFITGAYNVAARAPLTVQGRTPFGWVDVARLR
ncbi:hypothetical protein [Deinococcus petrolearius]|uniref:Lipoprotein n=1 Tax=Deinococcus petrolearius TaxID=1751295 RepID=A0ABW1DES9_9DEIO